MIQQSSTAVFEVWHNHRIFSKEAYKNTETAQKSTTQCFWADSDCFVQEGILNLSESRAEEVSKKNKCLLTFHTEQTKQIFLPRTIPEFFRIRQNKEHFSLISLPTNSISHGYPLRRQQYTLYTFTAHKPVRILINTRTWHTLSSRRATQYYEYDFLYHYRGFFEEYTLNDKPKTISQSCENIKTIDLRKVLF